MNANPPAAWATPANALTALRLALAPATAAAIVHGHPLAAGVLFTIAVVTDLLDGPVARRRNEATARGALFDHAVDATFVTFALAALAYGGALTPLLPMLVMAAFLQYMFDSAALRGRELRASRIGRYNGIGYFVLVGIPVVRDALGLQWPAPGIVTAAAWILVLSTIISMSDRAIALIRARQWR